MKYFTPTFKLSADLPPQTELKEKVGGLPWGLPPQQYPICSDCGRSQTLLIQLVHHPERLDLGKPGRTLLVFQCTYEPAGYCQTWAGGHGANACLILEPEDLICEMTPLPADNPELGIEAEIVNWTAHDDGIPDRNVTPNGQIWSLPDEDMDTDAYFKLCDRAYVGTKLGGAPAWVQDQGEAPSPNWNFVAQLDEQFKLEEKPTATDSATLDLMQRNHIHAFRRLQEGDYSKPRSEWQWIEDGTWLFSGPNLGCGSGYIFVQPSKSEPKGWFFSQC
ncbi:hypothetical protein S7335_248 [Synechococcus sp. PCC 7335]|uniref:hypothetical protein n=1 Tax=Synechococcus sp. (strain ATCC 29403 / PCC 7335) TaxID=91464 RepID=UPI00017ED29E|nr:hypothetical protein [Synechococcus sp. PCC 7335]EDX83070.1 hypothetical protein S7335_248 [Synechococcus sp. PCC 7335]